MENVHGSTRPDRKTVERNRRIHMKSLYSKLNSLLPNTPPNSREGTSNPSLPDRLEEAANYIKGLQEKLEKMSERKRQLKSTEGSTSHATREVVGGSSSSSSSGRRSNIKLPHIEVQDLGFGLKVIIISSPSEQTVFYEAIRALEEEGAEVLNAHFSVVGAMALHTMHTLVGDSTGGLEAGKVLETLKKAIVDADVV
ncbi:transcription factor bHLH162-like [Typha angustifolia]|uniref:transcription factor bHLH162-like n=1 Tax=Typha angustifolia TaxID=59011 RepID=UPI003C2C47D3